MGSKPELPSTPGPDGAVPNGVNHKNPDVIGETSGPKSDHLKTGQKRKKSRTEEERWAKDAVNGLRRNRLVNPVDPRDMESLQVAQQLILSHATSLSGILPTGFVPKSELVASVLADVASCRLDGNPDYLFAKAAQLQASIGADMAPEIKVEARVIINSLGDQARKLYLEQKHIVCDGNPTEQRVALSQADPDLGRAVDQFAHGLLGESGMTQPIGGSQAAPNREKFFDPSQPGIEIKPEDFSDYKVDRGGNGESRAYDRFLDDLTAISAVADRGLEEWNNMHWLGREYMELNKFSAAPTQVRDYYADKILQQMTIIRKTALPEGVHALATKSDWLTARINVPADAHDQVKRVIEYSRQFGGETHAENLAVLNDLIDAIPRNFAAELKPQDMTLIENMKRELKYTYERMKPTRLQVTPEMTARLRDPKTRDEEFFKVMQPLLDDPNETSHEILNLYKTSDIDDFMDQVERISVIGQKLKQHFTALKRAIVSFHDLDFYTRTAAGDVKSIQQAMQYFSNDSAVLAMSDPIIETMSQCFEQALKKIRNDNNGYIPPGLVSWNSRTQENYWDKLAQEIFEKKVKAGLVFDYKRDPETGFGIMISKRTKFDRLVYDTGEQFSTNDLGTQRLRIEASMQIAKGMGLLNGHLIEIFAFSKTPGYASGEYGTKDLVFASKAYEGVARWFNPMADWFGKYKMGDSMFAPFFASLIGVDRAKLPEFLRWSTTEWKKITELAATGELHEYLEKRYGKKVAPLLDYVTEFAFSGRFGPLSTWGENDCTIGLTDLEREREGGSLRLMRAKKWAVEQVSRKWVDETIDARYGRQAFNNMSLDDRDEISQKLMGEWSLKFEHDHKVEHLIKEHEHAYKAWVWVQTVMRSPTIIAGEIKDPSSTIPIRGEQRPRLLRNVIIQEILQKPDGTALVVERDIASERSLSDTQLKYAARVTLLESDVMLVQQRALNGIGADGKPQNDGAPRNIDLSLDVEAIVGDQDGVDQQTRREQAKKYIQLVQKKMLGEWTYDEWVKKIGVELGSDGKIILDDHERMQIKNVTNANHILEEAAHGGALITESLIDKSRPMHMGLEDVQWRYFDLEALGERQWARRGNDLAERAGAINAIIKHLDTLRPHPDIKEIAKTLEDIYNAEKNHDPNHAHKFAFLIAKATGEMYREPNYGKIPLLGRVFANVLESSIAQQVYGASQGAHWSTNNMLKYIHDIENAIKLPKGHLGPDGVPHEYNLHRLERELGATNAYGLLEFAVIASALIPLGVALAGAFAGWRDTSKDESN